MLILWVILFGIILTSICTFFTYSAITVPWRFKSFVSPPPAHLHSSLVLSFLASSFWPLGLVSVVIISRWMTECLQEKAYGFTAVTDYLLLLYRLPRWGVCKCVRLRCSLLLYYFASSLLRYLSWQSLFVMARPVGTLPLPWAGSNQPSLEWHGHQSSVCLHPAGHQSAAA